MHPRLELLERRHALLVERDDLAVDDRLVRARERLRDLMRLGVLRGAVEQVARLETHDAAVNEGERADAIPFWLEREVRRIERLVRSDREHRIDLRIEDVILRDRAVLDHQPVAALVLFRLHEDPLAFEPLAVERDLVFALAVLE